jgi:hypothetical protein
MKGIIKTWTTGDNGVGDRKDIIDLVVTRTTCGEEMTGDTDDKEVAKTTGGGGWG